MKAPEVASYSRIPGLFKVSLDSYVDFRGENLELFSQDVFKDILPNFRVATVSLSRSVKNTIRGLHSDNLNTKCLKANAGAIQFFFLDTRQGNEGTWLEFNTTALANEWFVVPPGVCNGTLALTDCELLYLWSHGYSPIADQIHVKWNKYNLPWKTSEPILSDRDK